jgi:hypothetical protein
MARDGSGTYARTQSDYIFNTIIDQAKINSELNDFATEITNSVDVDGQSTWTGNMNAGSTKITALAVGTLNTDSITLGQSQDGGAKYAAGTGTDTITIGLSPAMTAYVAGQHFYFKQAAGANTGATTLNVDSVGAKAITKKGTTALAAGDIPASAMVHVVYDGTQFQLMNVGTDVGITADGVETLTNKSYDLGGTGNVLTGSLAEFNTALQSESFATLAGVESLTNKTFSGKLGAFLDTNGNYIQNEQGTDIASATPTVPTDGDYFDVTGTTGITAFTVAADRLFTLQFDGIVTLTHGVALLLAGAANITTAAGDIIIFKSTTANNVIMTGGLKVDGTSWVGGVLTASSTDTFTNKTIDANGTGNSITNIDVADLAVGTDGELITWDASGNPAVVAVGTAGHVLTSGGVGVAPTFQATAAGGIIVQVVNVMDGNLGTGTTLCVPDDTIPLISEGDEYMTLAITPTNASNILIIDVVITMCGGYAGGQDLIGALFNTDLHATQALSACFVATQNAYGINTTSFQHYVVAGTTINQE